jgi:hypothetical protein
MSDLSTKCSTRRGPGYPAIRMVEDSPQRLDHNPRRASGHNHSLNLGLFRIRKQHVLSELSEQPLTDSSSNRQCRLRDNLSDHCYSSLFHNEEYSVERRTEGGCIEKTRCVQEGHKEASNLLLEGREKRHGILNDGSEAASLNVWDTWPEAWNGPGRQR